jgi:hypothetical protein
MTRFVSYVLKDVSFDLGGSEIVLKRWELAISLEEPGMMGTTALIHCDSCGEETELFST